MDGQACFQAFRIWRERAMPAFRVVSTAWENPEKSWLVLIAVLLEHGRLLTWPCVHFDAHIHFAVNSSSGHATCRIELRSRPACYAIGIQLFRRGTRFNSEPLACLGWQLCSPLIHCRNHPKYQQLDILAKIDRVSQSSELRDFLARNFVVSR